MQAFIENYQLLYNEVIACGKDIHVKSNDLAETVDGLVKAFEALSELQKVIKEDRLTNIFNQVAKTMSQAGNHFAESGELIKLYCSSHLKYHLSETESY